jgi:hypothetical protein
VRFYRGIAVPAAEAESVIAEIQEIGLNEGQGRRIANLYHYGPREPLFTKIDLTREDTRPVEADIVAGLYACGDLDGASHYAWRHNNTKINDRPILIEFEAPISRVAVDGNDFLYNLFSNGDPGRTRGVLKNCFGDAVLRYVDKAWSSREPGFRIAMCDLAIHDPQVILAHHANRHVLGGRNGTLFRNAFMVEFPVRPDELVRVYSPTDPPVIPKADFIFSDLYVPNSGSRRK